MRRHLLAVAAGRITVYGLPIFSPRRVFSPGKAPTPPPVANDWLSPAINALNTGNNANVNAAYDTWTVLKATTLNAGNPWKITLPAPALSGGNIQFVGIECDNTSTQIIKLVGNAGTENIGPGTATSRILWAGESAVLYTDGTNWFKVAGDTVPMFCEAARQAASQTITGGTEVQVLVDTSIQDNTGLMFDGTNNQMVVQRPGRYHCWATIQQPGGVAASAGKISVRLSGNKTSLLCYDSNDVTAAGGRIVTGDLQCVAADTIQMWKYYQSTQTVQDSLSLEKPARFGVFEIPVW